MVSDKDSAAEQFIRWFADALDRAGVPQGRARVTATASRYGVSRTAAAKWLNGDALPDSKRMLSIVMDLEPGAAKHEMDAYRRIAQHVEDSTPVYISREETRPGYLRLPLLAMDGGMGLDVQNDGPLEVVTDLDVAEWWATANFPKPLSRIKVMTGRGDSNAGLINHGDLVFVDTMTNFFDGEGLYVFNWQGRALIKRLAPDVRSNKLKIISANKQYDPEFIEVDELDELQIAGRVVAWWTLRTH